jgi:two-component system cell cycle response regulator DivK
VPRITPNTGGPRQRSGDADADAADAAEVALDRGHQRRHRPDRGVVVVARRRNPAPIQDLSVGSEGNGFGLSATQINPDADRRSVPLTCVRQRSLVSGIRRFKCLYFGLVQPGELAWELDCGAIISRQRYRVDERMTSVETGSGSGDSVSGAKTVLIVEDNELNMKLFHDLLEAHGYNIIGTRDGMEALRIARDSRPDLILMDIQLPEVSGLEVTKWIKEDDRLKSIPVIAVTAFAMKGDEEKIREGGCEAYIAKPISVTNFLETVKKYLG